MTLSSSAAARICRSTPNAFSMVAVPVPAFSSPDTHARTSDGLMSPAARVPQWSRMCALYADSVLTVVDAVSPLRLVSHTSARASMVIFPDVGST